MFTKKLVERCAVLFASIALTVGCASTSRNGTLKKNQPPNVWLSGAPPEGSVDTYTVHMFWGGWDPDGEIAYYEYAITNNGTGPFNPADTVGSDKWHRVYANDTTLTFTADELVDTNTTVPDAEFRRSHTFFIRAVDEQGLASRQPAYRSFTARTLAPVVTINTPVRNGLNPALVPPITKFQWTATDFVSDEFSQQDPESVQWALVSTKPFNDRWVKTINYLRTDPASEKEWSPWKYYKLPGDSGHFWTTNPKEFGNYIFAIRAKDEAGAVTPVLDEESNVRRVLVSGRSSGPSLTVKNDFIGSVLTSTCTTPIVIVDLPAGVPLQFSWSADAKSYGGVVSGYRYGWDIADLSDPSQWEIDFTPFTSTVIKSPTRQFFFSTHTFTVEVVDNSGFCSRAEFKINFVQFTMRKSLLLIDDFPTDKDLSQAGWDNPVGRGILPSDAEHDQFWANMLDNVAGFNPDIDQIEVTGGGDLKLTTVADYRSIIWEVYSDKGTQDLSQLPLLYDFIQYRQKNPPPGGLAGGGKRRPNLLSLFMAAGGHVMITGRHPVQNSISRGLAGGVQYPFMTLYDQEGGQKNTSTYTTDNPIGDISFAYRDLCLETIDYGILGFTSRRVKGTVCNVVDLRKADGNPPHDDGMREAIPIDPNFPRLTLRPETAGPNKAHAPNAAGYDAEVYNPQYFFDNCLYAVASRNCFQPIYGLYAFDQTEPTFGQPVAFWTSTFADRVSEAPGAVGARSVVFGFPPVYFNPSEVKPGIEYILFNEWQLPRK